VFAAVALRAEFRDPVRCVLPDGRALRIVVGPLKIAYLPERAALEELIGANGRSKWYVVAILLARWRPAP